MARLTMSSRSIQSIYKQCALFNWNHSLAYSTASISRARPTNFSSAEAKMPSPTTSASFAIPKRVQQTTKNVWAEYAQLDLDLKPLNLAHGFANYLVTREFNDVLAAVAANADNSMTQYARTTGHRRLVEAVSALYGQAIGREIDPLAEVLITSGATEALFDAILGNVDEGDEVIIIEPFFATYEPMIELAGGKIRHVQLKLANEWNDGIASSADFVLDDDELRAVFSDKTKMIILNTPHNPLGKIYNRKELQKIADLCQEFNVICVSDEVYEWMIYEQNEHVSICSLPGMWDRTITIGSAGKALTVTGWRTGWAYGSAALIRNMTCLHANTVYACPTPVQEALGIIIEREMQRLGTPESFFQVMSDQLVAKRDFMVNALRDIGMKVVIPQGGYFMVADWANLESKADLSAETDATKDFRFTKWLTKNIGVMTIPPTAFLSEGNKASMESYVRFCFFKEQDSLENAMGRLRKWALEH